LGGDDGAMPPVAPLSDLPVEFGLALAIALGLLATALIGLVGSGRARLRERRAADRPVRDVRWRAVEEARLRAEAASEAKSRFLATVSHEFRTPLNGILGMAALLRDTGLSAEQLTYVDAVTGSAEAFLSLVEEILDFSRIEAGHIELVEAPFAPEALVQGVTELLAPRAQGKGIEIACFVERDVPALVVGDRDRLRQVLFNLAGNAVKFTQAGGVGITLRRGPGGLSITVDDTGPGIEPDRLQRIFDEFEAGPSPESGTGLGLAITRRILARMGGAIRVESALDKGSRFEVSLPLDDAPESSGASEPATRRSPDFKDVSVLILGPSPFELAFLSRRLREGGAHVRRALDQAEAATALERGRFDVFLVDAAIGEERAREMAALARRAGVGRAIVLVSPFERREFGPPGAAGFDAYLMKPVRARSLAGAAARGRAGSDVIAPGVPASPTVSAHRTARARAPGRGQRRQCPRRPESAGEARRARRLGPRRS
jgi:signal transduction histidine kinase/CheY-like chemotaxis protein